MPQIIIAKIINDEAISENSFIDDIPNENGGFRVIKEIAALVTLARNDDEER